MTVSTEISHLSRTPDSITRDIIKLLMARANLLGNIEHVFESVHFEKMRCFVENQQKIQLILPAFPAKSPNEEKTSGILPDMGEVVALKFIDDLCLKLEAIHPPGAEMIICSDGRVFGDLVRVSDEDVSLYSKEIKQILCEFGLARIRTYDLDDFFPGTPYHQMREKLVNQYATPVSEIRDAVKDDEDMKCMFNGIHRFMFEDQLVLDRELSRNMIRKNAKEIAYKVIQRSNAWSSLVEKKFPEGVRLSIHPHTLDSGKLGIQLVECEDRWGTPWHNVALCDENGWYLTKRKYAEEIGARLVHFKNKYAFFTFV